MKRNEYDSIIIGGGFAGLICGNFLAKAGQKVLICEKNPYVGGCCCAFVVDKYKIESGIHSIEGYQSHLKQLIAELDLKLSFKRKEVTDIILFPDKEVKIFSDFEKTKECFDKILRVGKSDIDNLDNLTEISLKETLELKKFKNAKELIYSLFRSELLRKTFLVFTRNIGVPGEYLSAVNYAIFLKAYLTDNGYYLSEGIDVFPKVLKDRFSEYGGEVKLGSNVENIIIKNNAAVGIRVSDKSEFYATNVISAGDFFETVKKLLDIKPLVKKMERMKTTVSSFVIYLAFPLNMKDSFKDTSALWIADKGDCDNNFASIFNNADRNLLFDDKVIMLGSMPKRKNYFGMYITSTARFENEVVWNRYRNSFCDKILAKVERRLAINLRSNSLLMNTATPNTFYKFTNNNRGALHGWAPIQKQINFSTSDSIQIKNLFFTGHWNTGYGQGGIPWTVNRAIRTARIILSKNES